jgi:hypothetical protein
LSVLRILQHAGQLGSFAQQRGLSEEQAAVFVLAALSVTGMLRGG